MNLFKELQRRNVFRMAIGYVVSCWLLVQVADLMMDAIGAPDWVLRAVLLLMLLGLPVVVFFSWAYEVTPEGIKRESEVDRSQSITHVTGRKMDRAITVVLAIAVVFLLVDKFWYRGAEPPSPQAPAATEQAERSVAVLPFVAMSSGEDDAYFADGLTEEILNSLAAIPELMVTARTSAFYFKGTDLPIPEIAATLGVAHVVEGSVRRDAERVRITAQLIRAHDGFHLWSQTYDRTLEDVFAVQEDIAVNIAAVLDVVLDSQAMTLMRNAGIGNVEAFIAYQKGNEAFTAAHSDIESVSAALVAANDWYDQVLEVTPGLTDVRLKRADLLGHKLFEITAVAKGETDPAQELDVIRALLDEYALAWESARPGAERAMVEAERQMFSDDWSGMADTLDQALSGEKCLSGNWINQLGQPYGWAEKMVDWIGGNLRCDPLSGFHIMSLVAGHIWAGDAELGLQELDDADALGLDVPFEPDIRLAALLAAGRTGTDAPAYRPGTTGSIFPFPDGFLSAALAGNADKARPVAEAHLARAGVDGFTAIVAAAAVGDREAANEIAARIDARPGGPFLLMTTTQLCFCGAPFEIEATPNFKARLDEAGFAWPPPEPIDYPLKSW